MKKIISVLLALSLALGVFSIPLGDLKVEAATKVYGVTKTVKLGWGKDVMYLNSSDTKKAKKSINDQMKKVGKKSDDMKIDGIPGISFIWNSGLQNAKAFLNISANTFLYYISKADKGRGVKIYFWLGIPYSSSSQ